MALLDVTDAFVDTEEPIIVNVRLDGTRDHGMWTDGNVTPIPCEATVQPMTDNEVNSLDPDGDTTVTRLKFYIDVDKYPMDLDAVEDVSVEYDANQYKALRIKNYSKLGGFCTIYTVQTKQ